MGYLVDTNVISETAKRAPNPGVIQFLDQQTVLLSCLVFGELNYGAHQLKPDHPRRSGYLNFIEQLRQHYEDAIIPISLGIAELAGRLRATEKRQGRVLEMADALIAATAIHTNTTLVTRNTKDFANLDIPLLNPFAPD